MLFLLTAFLIFASLAFAARHYRQGRLEPILAACGVWAALTVVPAFVLGWAGWLTATTVGAASALCATGIILASIYDAPRQRLRETAALAKAGLLLPWTSLAQAWRERSIVILGLLAVVAILVWTAILSYLGPSNSWDGVWYHESIVGYAIQNRGFSWVSVSTMLEVVNGYPPMSELFSLWFVIFSDRTLIELPQTVFAGISMLAFTGLARRVGATSVHAMGWGSVLVLLPSVSLQLRSTYTDVVFMGGLLLALYFVTRPQLRVVDLIVAAILSGMVGSMKGFGIALSPMLGLVLVIRAFCSSSPGIGWKRALTGAFTLVVLFSLASPTYIRNWKKRNNPVWPLKTKVPVIDVPLKGTWALSETRKDPWDEILSPPKKRQLRDTRNNGYGNVLPFLLPLLLLLAAARLFLKMGRRRHRPPLKVLAWTTLVILPATLMSPGAFWWARLNLHWFPVVLLVAAWAVTSERFHTLADGVLGVCVVGSLITLYWSQPAWDISPKLAWQLARKTPEERYVHRLSGMTFPTDRGLARERELTKDKVIAYDGYYRFTGSLWNTYFSNKIVYVRPNKDSKAFLRRLDEVQAIWVVVRDKSPSGRALAGAKGHWQKFGSTLRQGNFAYRRIDHSSGP